MQTAKTDKVRFDVSRDDAAIIERITGRAVRLTRSLAFLPDFPAASLQQTTS